MFVSASIHRSNSANKYLPSTDHDFRQDAPAQGTQQSTAEEKYDRNGAVSKYIQGKYSPPIGHLVAPATGPRSTSLTHAQQTITPTARPVTSSRPTIPTRTTSALRRRRRLCHGRPRPGCTTRQGGGMCPWRRGQRPPSPEAAAGRHDLVGLGSGHQHTACN